MRKKLIILSTLVLLLCTNTKNIFAASFNVNTKNNNNGTCTITVSGPVVGGLLVEVAGQTSKLAIRNIGGSDSTTVSTGPGTFNIVVTAISLSDANYNLIENEKVTKTVTVTTKNNNTPPTTQKPSEQKPNNTKTDYQSKENDLSSLSISQGALSPKFSSGTTSYKVDFTSDISKFTIDAKAKDSKAKVSGTGEKELKIGENNFIITVVAENGAKKTYTISAYITVKPSIFVKFSDKDYGILSDFSKVDLPKGFSPTTVRVDGKEVAALKNDASGLTLLYLQDSEGATGFYIYEKNAVIGKFQTITFNQRVYTILNDENAVKELSGVNEDTIKISDIEVKGWVFVDKKLSNYSLVYLMNDTNEKCLYLYESTEGTLQKYVFTGTSSNNTLTYIFIGTTILFITTSGMSILMYYNFRKKTIREVINLYTKKET